MLTLQKPQVSSLTGNLPCPIFSREIRLGIVLYGGVSLAIYMNGVCQEFYNAIRGRGIYKLIKALTDSDIIVDIVSGTSAGGVNGVLLSYAIANSSEGQMLDFQDLAELWRDKADLDKLANKSNPKPPQKTPVKSDSCLNGEYYQQELEKALEKMPIHDAEKDWYSEFSELDLFITATDLKGRITQNVDHTGKVCQIKEHRAVFHLSYRQDQVKYIDNPFKAEKNTQKALAKLCRMTSCFPLAFPVVSVTLGDQDPIDTKLVQWGELYNRENLDQTLNFIDGGLLDNRPFSYTIQNIYYRTAYRPVDRKLFYVDPNPDEFLTYQTPEESTYFRSEEIAKSILSIPLYQSINKDLKAIKEGNRKVLSYNLLRDTVNSTKIKELRESKSDKNNNPQKHYIQCRLFGLLDNLIQQIIRKSPDSQEQQKQEEYLAQIGLFIKDIAAPYLDKLYKEIHCLDIYYFIRKHEYLLKEVEKISETYQQKIEHQQSCSHNYCQEYLELRYLAYQLTWQIQLLKIIQKAINKSLNYYSFSEIYDSVVKSQNGDPISDFLQTFHQILLKNNDLTEWELFLNTYYELFKKIYFPQEINFDNREIDWTKLKILLPEKEVLATQEIFAQIYEFPVCAVLKSDNPKDTEQKIKKIKDKIARSLTPNQDDQNKTSESILEIIETHSRKLIETLKISNQDLQNDQNNLLNIFDNFQLIDEILYPYEYLSDIKTKNIIELVETSTKAAQRGFGKDKSSQQKLMGYQYGGFAGFFTKFWRSNDILWGRLDGVNRLVDALITPESLGNFHNFLMRHKGKLEIEEYLNQLIQDSFSIDSMPLVREEERQEICDFLCNLFDQQGNDSQYQPESEEMKKFLENIIKAGQRQILYQDFPTVIKDMDKGTQKALQKSLSSEKIKSPLNELNLSPQQQNLIYTDLSQLLKEMVQQGQPDKILNLLDLVFEHYQEQKSPLKLNQLSPRQWIKLLDMGRKLLLSVPILGFLLPGLVKKHLKLEWPNKKTEN